MKRFRLKYDRDNNKLLLEDKLDAEGSVDINKLCSAKEVYQQKTPKLIKDLNKQPWVWLFLFWK